MCDRCATIRPMKKVMLALIVCMVASAAAFSRAQDDVGDLLGRVNALRGGAGRAALTLNGALTAAAQDQAQWIADNGTVSHTRPDGSSPRSRAVGAGYPTSDVSENIYGGSSAAVNDAWSYWVNSSIHYRGLVNERYRDIGIGVGRSAWGTAYVLVFGNPGGPPPAAPASSSGSGGGASARTGPPTQPSFVLGLDEHGNIKHEVQPGDTLGDILLIYGYTWEVLPYVQQLNGITETRDLEIGSIVLIPPKAGTYTPTPGDPVISPSMTPTPEYPTPFPENPALYQVTASAAPSHAVATAAAVPDNLVLVRAAAPTATPSPTDVWVAAVPTRVTVQSSSSAPAQALPGWLIIGLGVQAMVLVGAVAEFIRRSGRKR